MKKIFLLTSTFGLLIATPALAQNANKYVVEGGFSNATGNTDNQNLNTKIGVTSTFNDLTNQFTATAFNASQNNVRSGEQYTANDKLKKDITNIEYVYGEADWSNDRFMGYSDRLSGNVGVGHHFMKEANLDLYAEGGVGYRKTDYIPNAKDDENSVIGKVGGGLNWKLNDNVEFVQTVNSGIGEENIVTIADTSVKSFLDKQLYMKVGYNIENMTEVPANRKNTDTITSISLGYGF
jgi:putative salt-induced outer membrane protein